MNIGLYISPAHTVPPDEHNILAPWVLVGQLADGLVDRGHTVTLFAAKGSKTKARLVHNDITPSHLLYDQYQDRESYNKFKHAKDLELFRALQAEAKKEAFDIIHVHTAIEQLYPALAALRTKAPVVATFHDIVEHARYSALQKVLDLGNIYFIGLSQAQFRNTGLPTIGIVPNGIDTKRFTPDNELTTKDKPLLMTGRIVPQKGFTDGIAAAGTSGNRLLIVGQAYTNTEIAKNYFEKDITPHIDGKRVFWEPVVKPEHLIGHYQTAKALLFPIHWEEPFGLVMIEAMSCGLPVIAYNRGSVSEVVRDGITGFVIDEKKGVPGLVEAISKIDQINPADCRTHVENNFTIAHMVTGYEKVYENTLRHQ